MIEYDYGIGRKMTQAEKFSEQPNVIFWTDEAKEKAIDTIDRYLSRHGVGECIMQSDSAIIDAPHILSFIIDEVIGEECVLHLSECGDMIDELRAKDSLNELEQNKLEFLLATKYDLISRYEFLTTKGSNITEKESEELKNLKSILEIEFNCDLSTL